VIQKSNLHIIRINERKKIKEERKGARDVGKRLLEKGLKSGVLGDFPL
jgi:hypothetical protein